MVSFETRRITEEDMCSMKSRLEKSWGSLRVVSRGKLHRLDLLPGYVAVSGDDIVGVVIYRIEGGECEVVTLESFVENSGIGTALMKAAISEAKSRGCGRVWLVTTNDNTKAMRFYQKRGFSMVAVHRNAVDGSRKIKPEIPETGNDGIRIKDEVEFEILL